MTGATSHQLLARLTDEGVRYCLWKSNAHLGAGLSGDTDLDILFDGAQIQAVHRIMAGEGFKRFPTSPIRSYPGKEDFFGVDPGTGRLLHLDTHYRLVVGASYFKNFRLPWEDKILATATLDSEHGVYVADPALELLILIVRAALKMRPGWQTRLGRRAALSTSMAEERDWLLKQVDRSRVVALGRDLLGSAIAGMLETTLADGVEVSTLRELRAAVMRSLRGYRSFGPVLSTGVRRKRQIQHLFGAINRRYFHAPFGYSRGGTAGGLIVAVVGPGGSGRSTLSRSLFRWLTSKLDVMPVSFVSGNGGVPLIRIPLRNASVKRARKERAIAWKRAAWALALARRKQKRLDRATRARARGLIVLCDQYPQTQRPGVDDGPFLAPWQASPSRVRRYLAEIEARPYDHASRVGPDLVLCLRTTPAVVARHQETNENPANPRFRAEAGSSLMFPAARRIVEIDASRGADAVLREAKSQLWLDL